MDIDFTMDQDMIVLVKNDPVKEKTKKRKSTVSIAQKNLRKMMLDRISGKTGDC